MPTPPLITLDTSCVSALANPSSTNDPSEVAALDSIIELAQAGVVKLQVTTAYDRDFDRWKDEVGRRERLDWLASVPLIERAPGVFRLDVSRLNGPDLLGGSGDVVLDGQLRALLEPNRRSVENLANYEDDSVALARIMSDVDHLIAHNNSGADWFATLDEGILGKRESLRELGIQVARPTEIVVSI
jgi:hypothetical protein